MYFKKKLKEIEMKMSKFRNIAISQIPTKPDRNYKQITVTCIIIRYLYSFNVKLFTNEVDLLRKLLFNTCIISPTTWVDLEIFQKGGWVEIFEVSRGRY
jgi:hypothetical protein